MGCIAAAAGLYGPQASATIEHLKTFKQAYPDRPASCKICHTGLMGRKDNLNAYGQALLKFKSDQAGKLTVEDLQAVEKDDADQDGAANGDELKGGTDPGDPDSKPEPAAPSARRLTPFEKLPTALSAWLIPETYADVPAKPAAAQKKEPAVEEPQKKAEYAGAETCAACHTKQAKEFEHSSHARVAVPGDSKDVGAQGCETCHGPGSLHAEAGGGKGVGDMKNPGKDPSACFECHLDKKAELRLPYHHPILEGKMSCADCHNAHGEEVRPWSATTLQGINEACFKCHKEQRGPFVYEHEALREGCTSCHKVHGSIHQGMLLVRDSNLCFRCHTQTDFPTIGDRSHSTSFREGTCFSAGCHTAPHGSNFDDHLRY